MQELLSSTVLDQIEILFKTGFKGDHTSNIVLLNRSRTNFNTCDENFFSNSQLK